MTMLPPGWVRAPVIDLMAQLQDGRNLHQGWSPQCAQGPSPNSEVWGVLKTTSIQDGRFFSEHNKRLPDALAPRILLEVHEGDVLVTCAGPRMRCGVPCLVRSTRPKLILSGKMYRMRALEPVINSRFVEAMLRAPATQDAIDGMKTGMSESGMNLTHGRFAELEIPVPPTNEQRRIADRLDAVLERVDTCRDRLDRIPAILKRFRQSVVSAATNGLLTHDWRMRNFESTEKSMVIATLAEQCLQGRVITYGVIKLGDEFASGVPCLRTSNVRWLKVEIHGMKRISQSLSNEYPRTILQGGEVLVNVRGTLGGVAVAEAEMIGWNVSREVAVVPVDPSKINPQFLAFWIGAERSQQWLTGVERGVAYTGINIEDLRTLPVEIPKLEEQAEIVRRVDSLFAFADRLEARYTAARAQVENLTPATLAKAFRGELVPQDPSDEPAEVLLERIRAKRGGAAADNSKPKRGRKSPQARNQEETPC